MEQQINGSYHLISKVYDALDLLSEIQYHRSMREKWITTLRNEKIIELGVGTGKNLQYYHHTNKVIGIDISPQMLFEARDKMRKHEYKADITLSLQKKIPWDIDDRDFTIGVATFVFCTMVDPTNVLDELLGRIVKGGRIILFEYIRPQNNPIYSVMKVISHISKRLYGVDFNRKPSRNYLQDNITSINTTKISDMIEVVEIIK